MADIDEMQKFFGFSMGDTQQKKVEAVKKKAKKIEKLEEKENPTSKDKREIDMYEALGMPRMITSDPDRKKKQDDEADKSLLVTMKKMGLIN